MKVLITGGTGRLGRTLCKLLSKTYEVIAPSKKEMDLREKNVIEYIKRSSPGVVIHTAALTSVDYCEKNKMEAYLVNVVGSFYIAKASSLCNAKMVYVSTDYVFDGKMKRPYHEKDIANPVNYYGITKLQGERIIQDIVKKFFIVRTAWLFGSEGKEDFIDFVLKESKERKELKFTDDHIGSPSYVKDIAKAIQILIESDYYGIYHIVNKGEATRKIFAEEVLKVKNIRKKIMGVKGNDVGFIAPRPYYTVLSPELFENRFKVKIRSWKDALWDYLKNTCKD